MADTPKHSQRLHQDSTHASPGHQQQQGQGDASSHSTSSERTTHIASASPLSPSPRRPQSTTMLASTPGKRSVSNKENIEPRLRPTPSPMTPLRNSTVYDALEAAVVDAATPPAVQSTPHSPQQQPEVEQDLPAVEQLKLVDSVHEPEPMPAAEHVSRVAEKPTQVEALSPPAEQQVLIDTHSSVTAERPETRARSPMVVDRPQTAPYSPILGDATLSIMPQSPQSPQQSPPPRSKKNPNPGPRPTKASMARISLAHGGQGTPRAPAWGPPRQTSGNTRLSISSSQRVTSDGSTASDASIKKEVVIPHSKPRPMSMSFPTPAPLPKSAKAPTRPTFQLPGEVFAQKMKEARELREKSNEDATKRVFKARPVPSSNKAAPAVRPTNTSRARETLGLGKDSTSAQATPLHSRANSVAVVRPADRKPSVSSRATSSGSDKPSVLGVSGRLYNPQRASSSMANIGKPRDASPPYSAVSNAAAAAAAAAPVKSGPISGKEVYNRHIFASEAAEREKREKEEATKRARAEAAERSRLLSREWAAKKRQQQAVSQA